MAYSYDFLVAEMKCPVCGSVSPADDSTEMYTYIRDHPNADFLRAGSLLSIDIASIAGNTCDGYYTIQVPEPGEPIRLLNPWHCPVCGAYNWAETEVHNNIIVAIFNVPLNRHTLEGSHLISNEADFVAAGLAGIPWNEYKGQNAVQILLERL